MPSVENDQGFEWILENDSRHKIRGWLKLPECELIKKVERNNSFHDTNTQSKYQLGAYFPISYTTGMTLWCHSCSPNEQTLYSKHTVQLDGIGDLVNCHSIDSCSICSRLKWGENDTSDRRDLWLEWKGIDILKLFRCMEWATRNTNFVHLGLYMSH